MFSILPVVNLSASTEGASSSAVEVQTNRDNKSLLSLQIETEASTPPKQPTISQRGNQTDLEKNLLKVEKMGGSEACTPKPPMISQKANLTDSKKHQAAKKIASLVKNPSALKSKIHSQLSQVKGTKPPSSTARRLIQLYAHQTSFSFSALYWIWIFLTVLVAQNYREPKIKNPTATPNLAQEHQAIKRQKLDGGKTRQVTYPSARLLTLLQLLLLLIVLMFNVIWNDFLFFFFLFFSSKCQILNVKPQIFPHKNSSNLCPSTAKTNKEDRKVSLKVPV